MKIRCTTCEKRFKVPETYRGRRVRCFNCSTVFHAIEDNDHAEEADVSLWRGAISQAAERYGGYEAEAAPPPAVVEEDLIEATLEEEGSSLAKAEQESHVSS